MKWQINFLNKFDETEFLAQVQYDLRALNEGGEIVRSVARDEGRVFLYSPSGLATIEMIVREEPGTARYAVWFTAWLQRTLCQTGPIRTHCNWRST